MKRNCVQNVIVHIPDNMDLHALSDKINEFHLEVVERRLNSSNLTTDDKIAVIDKILDNLKSRELDGIIKKVFVKPPYIVRWLCLFLFPAANGKMFYVHKLCKLLLRDMVLFTIGLQF